MKYLYLLLCLLFTAPFAQAQSKKVLKQQLAAMQAELQKSEAERRRTTQRLRELEAMTANNQQQIVRLNEELNRLKADSVRQSLRIQQLSVPPVAAVVDAVLPCGANPAKLEDDQSYYLESLRPMGLHGWGVQVYSFTDLCTALAKARQFRNYYQMYNTYLRVKEGDNGERLYTVVYASLRDQQQAQVYLKAFRAKGRDEAQKNAFLVRH